MSFNVNIVTYVINNMAAGLCHLYMLLRYTCSSLTLTSNIRYATREAQCIQSALSNISGHDLIRGWISDFILVDSRLDKLAKKHTVKFYSIRVAVTRGI